MRHQCTTLALGGLALGLAWSAWAQDDTLATASVVDPSTALLVDLLRAGGLPAVLGGLGYLLARWRPTVRVEHAIAADQAGEDATRLRALAERIAQLEKGP